MKRNISITIILFIISFLLIKIGVLFIRKNDNLMKTIKEKQKIYNKEPINAIITNNTMIPGISGKSINLNKSYNNMKGINEFKESLLVFDEIKPNKSINGIYNKVIVASSKTNYISIITNLNDKYCYTEDLTIKKECIQNHKYTILINIIKDNYLIKLKESINNQVFYLESINQDDYNIIIKYLKNNNYTNVTIDELIKE